MTLVSLKRSLVKALETSRAVRVQERCVNQWLHAVRARSRSHEAARHSDCLGFLSVAHPRIPLDLALVGSGAA
jgi:hypothetical protein